MQYTQTNKQTYAYVDTYLYVYIHTYAHTLHNRLQNITYVHTILYHTILRTHVILSLMITSSTWSVKFHGYLTNVLWFQTLKCLLNNSAALDISHRLVNVPYDN